MISKRAQACVLLLGLLLSKNPAHAGCFEFKSLGTKDSGTFFLGCEHQFGRLSYAVNEVIQENSRHSFVKLVTHSRGYMCFIENADSECKEQPFGPFLEGVYESDSGKSVEIDSFDSYQSWYEKKSIRRFPRTTSGAESTGCFLVQLSNEQFVLGLNIKRLPETRLCLIRLGDWK